MGLSTFLALFVSVAFAQAPTPLEYLQLNAVPAVMIEVARCESNYQQFRPDGTLTRDPVTGTHVGLFQISTSLHSKDGNDIKTPEGNIAEALLLYKKYGTKPWLASYNCWKHAVL